jgi:hypothetical protein
MTHFVHIESLKEHAAVARFEAAMDSVQQIRKGFDSGRGLAGGLLAAMVAALIVVADQLIETWADGDLLLAWVALWVIAFASLALLAPAARKLSRFSVSALFAWWRGRASKRADARLWALARRDPRVMADIYAAMSRD